MAHGANVVVSGRNEARARKALEYLRGEASSFASGGSSKGWGSADAVLVDVRDYGQVEKAMQSTLRLFGRLDILVNAAAGNFLCPVA